jgi:hypothetical protein
MSTPCAPTHSSHRSLFMAAVLAVVALLLCLAVRPTYAGGPTFVPGHPFGTGADATTSVATGDVDGDGDLDLIVGNAGQQNMVYINDQPSGFSVGRPFGTGADKILSVAVGDIDGDANLDIAIGNANQQNVVYLNDGSGNFASGPTDCSATSRMRCFGTGTDATNGLAVGDVDNDGDLDLIAGNAGRQSMVFINDGAGSFLSSRPFGMASDNTQSIAVADVDDDGDLDIVAGHLAQPNAVYINDGAGYFAATRLIGDGTGFTRAVVAGDIDGDDDLDLIFVSNNGHNDLYRNDGTGQFSQAQLIDTVVRSSWSAALGDLDLDGDIDLVVGNQEEQGTTYLNDGAGHFTLGAPFGNGSNFTLAVALADLDTDGDLDIVAGNQRQQSTTYLNDSAGALPIEYAIDTGTSAALSVAVADLNSDGQLDLVTGDYGGANTIYLNDGSGTFADAGGACGTGSARCFGTGSDKTTSVAVGDIDGNGDLDLIVGNDGEPSAVYFNDGTGTFPISRTVELPSSTTRSVAVGDMNGDGMLDLVVGNYSQPSIVYLNDGTGHFPIRHPFTIGSEQTWSVALGDLDTDGDLDLVAANRSGPVIAYHNDGSGRLVAGQSVDDAGGDPTSVALRDLDADGDLDIAIGNNGHQSEIAFNDGTGHFAAVRAFGGRAATRSIAASDINGDGLPDLVSGNFGQANVVYLNNGRGQFLSGHAFGSESDPTSSIAIADLNNDGVLDIVAGNNGAANKVYLNQLANAARLVNTPPRVTLNRPSPPQNADGFSAPRIFAEQIISITYTLQDRESDPVPFIRAFYSPDGGGRWLPAIGTIDTPTRDLIAPAAGQKYIFRWDTFASGFFGQSDNVVFRIDAFPSLHVAGPYQRAIAIAATFPFRVRGMQVRVVREGVVPTPVLPNLPSRIRLPLVLNTEGPLASPVSDIGALVYRIHLGRPGVPLSDSSGRPFRTNAQGYLQGRGELQIDDQLVALQPIAATDAYTMYLTNAQPNPTGLGAYPITASGVQTLTVASATPLVLFNLRISLEWDAHTDSRFMTQLQFDIRKTSDLLYDWTNGQAGLGKVVIYHNREHWNDADIRVYASNHMRPNADQGGIGHTLTSDPQAPTTIYASEQVRIGAVWNRFGSSNGNLSEDWPRALAHELGHYAFDLDDNYLGMDARGLLIPIDTCPGAMSDPYRNDYYSEFHPAAGWLPACKDSLSQLSSGRSDWDTITTFYPWLHAPTTQISDINPGPNGMPLDLPQIQVVAPTTAVATLDVPIFYLNQAGTRVQPGAGARAFLFTNTTTAVNAATERLIDLGRPTLDYVNARGAREGDRLCVYDLEASRSGCLMISPKDDQLTLTTLSNWRPAVVITPITSDTLSIRVTNLLSGLSLMARLFPGDDAAPTTIRLVEAPTQHQYAGTFHNLAAAILDGHVQVWVEDSQASPRREIVTDFSLGGNPGRAKVGGGRAKVGGSPVLSADGQVLIVGENLTFAKDALFALQAITALPSTPAWATVVGRGYYLTATTNAPQLSGTSISFNYLDDEVPPGEEGWVRIYSWDGALWNPLPTVRDTYYNLASAPITQPGLYALMSSIEIPLVAPGPNPIGYPVKESRPVREALRSIEGIYTRVRGYDPATRSWKVFDPNLPDGANTLKLLEFGRGYEIYVKHDVILRLKGPIGTAATNVISRAK